MTKISPGDVVHVLLAGGEIFKATVRECDIKSHWHTEAPFRLVVVERLEPVSFAAEYNQQPAPDKKSDG